MVTDAISDYFFVTEESGLENLVREGKPREKIYFVGQVMIDNLLYQAKKLETDHVEGFSVYGLKRANGKYAFLTLHRPSNVDIKENFQQIAE